MTRMITCLLGCVLFTASAVAGTAYYGGFADETGVPVGVVNMPTPPQTAEWVPFNAYFEIQESALPSPPNPALPGRVKYYFTQEDGTTTLSIVDGSVYSVYAMVWNPGAFADAAGRNYRFYIGIDPDANLEGQQIGVFGIDSNGSMWRFGSDNNAIIGNNMTTDDTGATVLDAGVDSWSTLEFLASRNAAGDLICQYKKDGAAEWSPFWVNDAVQLPADYGTGIIRKAALDAYTADVGNDNVQCSVRSWPKVGPVIVSGTNVPDVNLTGDYDSDGSTNYNEYIVGTDPLDPDSDDDGLLDGVETNTGVWVSTSNRGTDPNNPDSDGDGLTDNVETNTGVFADENDTGTNPNNPDTDGDSLSDGEEVANGSDPLVSADDSDGDGIPDSVENAAPDDPDSDGIPNALDLDSDGDGISDHDEWFTWGSDPYDAGNPDHLPVTAIPFALAFLGVGIAAIRRIRK